MGEASKGAPTRKQTVEALLDLVLTEYKPKESPKYIDWHVLWNRFQRERLGELYRPLKQDEDREHKEWKSHGRLLVRELQGKGIIVVSVNKHARFVIGHGLPPDRGGYTYGRDAMTKSRLPRTDDHYRKCLPVAGQMIRGFVCFPPDQQKDHPLIYERGDRRMKTAATVVEGAAGWVDTASRHGVLSDDARNEIRSHMIPRIAKAINPHPLFQAIEEQE